MLSSEPHPEAEAAVPYAFEKVQRDSEGAEVARLEAQNLLFDKLSPLDQLPPTPADGAILDAGSGTGFWSLRLAARVPQGSLTCLDRSEELLSLATRRLEAVTGTRKTFLHQDLRHLALPERAFDLVFTSMTLAHVRELEGTLDRLAASLKPGGWLACFEPVHQSSRFCQLHPPCANLDVLLDSLVEEVESRGTDLSVGLKIAHHLDRMGLEEVTLRNYGTALRGEDTAFNIREVFMPLARAYLRHRWEPALLARRLEAADREAGLPHLWMDLRRAVILARARA